MGSREEGLSLAYLGKENKMGGGVPQGSRQEQWEDSRTQRVQEIT